MYNIGKFRHMWSVIVMIYVVGVTALRQVLRECSNMKLRRALWKAPGERPMGRDCVDTRFSMAWNKKEVNCDLSFSDFDSFIDFLLNVEVKDTSIYLVIDEASSLTDEQLLHLNATLNKLLANNLEVVVSILSYTVLLDKFEGELERFVLETKRT